ncbi:MAG TPA: hypothetical protein VEK15_14895, partial [Vicinamibacteria bacterium]|nr:hypothetical protein [Vicinamibacteria bacterium]
DDIAPNVKQVTRSTIDLPDEAPLARVAPVGIDMPKIAISPDGDRIVHVAESDGGTALFVREIDGYQMSRVPGTEGAILPFFSPDGTWVGFLTNDQVKKVSLRGDRPFTLGDATTPVRAFWTPDGSILVSSNGGQAVSRISAEGGGDFSHIASLSELFPRAHWTNMTDVSPDGTAALAAVWLRSVSGDYADIHWIDLKTWRTERIALFGYDARFAGEFIVFARGGALMAAPWEEAELRSGEPVPAISGVRMESFFGQSQFSISRSGTLLYVPGSDRAIGRIASLDRRGNAKFLDVPQRAYAAINVSPDDQRLVVNVADSNDYLWIYDLERQEGRRLAAGTVPLWSPKGDEIVFSRADPDHGWRVFTLPVSRPEQPREVLASEFRVHPSSWSPDGSTIALTHEGTANRMSFLNIRGEPNLTMASPGGSYHLFPSFSPDGKWIAYGSGETGRFEIWVRSYPNGETARQISVDGGVEPVWCDNGELLYRVGNQWMVVSITTGPELSWEPPRPIFSSDFIDTPRGTWDVTSDGQRVFIFRRTSEDERTKFRLVTNWFSELKRLVPTN